MATTSTTTNEAQSRTVLICYDGSEAAGDAIAEAGRELGPGRPAIVLYVWEPFTAGFASLPAVLSDPDGMLEKRARRVAREGTELARTAGFEAEPMVAAGAPIWRPIVEIARDRDADLIVLGAHHRSALGYLLFGSIATAVAQHAGRTILIASDGRTHQLLPATGNGAERLVDTPVVNA